MDVAGPSTKPKPGVKRKSTEVNQGTKPKRVFIKLPCLTCGKEVDSRKMAQHKQIHSEFCYDCCFCNYKNCKNLDYMQQHYCKMHSTAGHKCKECGIQYASEEAFFDDPHLSDCIKKIAFECPPLKPIPVDD